MSQLETNGGKQLRSSARVDPNRGLQDHGSGRLLTGGSRTSSSRQASSRLTDRGASGSGSVTTPSPSLHSSSPNVPPAASHLNPYANSGWGSGNVSISPAAVPPLSSARAQRVSSGERRAAQVHQLIGFDVLECTDVGVLQRRLVELADKLLQLEAFYDEQQRSRCIWYQQCLAAITGCLPLSSSGTSLSGHLTDLPLASATSTSSHNLPASTSSGGLALPISSSISVPSLPFSPREKGGASASSVGASTHSVSGLRTPLTSGGRQVAATKEDHINRKGTTRRSGTSSGTLNTSASGTGGSNICETSLPMPSVRSGTLKSPSSGVKEEEKKKNTKSKRQK